jgi:plasmid stabilization system protein ParE
LKYASRAERDLGNIWDYIAKDSAEAADRVIREIHYAARGLCEFPGKGHDRADRTSRRAYRVWMVYSYAIVYRYTDEYLLVMRVIHGAREMPNVIRRGIK